MLICSGDHRFRSLPCTQPRSSSLPASLAVFGRRARTSARYCAAVARYDPPAELLRSTSRLTVETGRPSPSAISSRSAIDRYRPDTGPGPLALTPPASANHRCTRQFSPAAAAASHRPSPARTPCQNRTRASLGAGGRPPFSSTTTSRIRNRCNDQLNPPPQINHEARINHVKVTIIVLVSE